MTIKPQVYFHVYYRSRVCSLVCTLVFLLVATAPCVPAANCLPCHSAIVMSYAKTGMGRSISSPVEQELKERKWIHAASGQRAESAVRSRTLMQSLGSTERSMAFAIGSGNAGKSFVWKLEDALFQSPISWYRKTGGWDMSPGYENDAQANFYRPITAECLTCHANSAGNIPGTQNRYLTAMPGAIGCERCHGASEEHERRPARGNIVNPARLSPRKRDSVCQSCHLGGEARIPNAGKRFSDFAPGMALEEVFQVYVSGDGSGRVTGHAEQIAASRCANDVQLWCGSCHDPHRKPDTGERDSYYRARCVQCHDKTASHEAEKGQDCIGCHMPRAASHDGGHTAFTDHRILIRPPAASSNQRLRAWRPESSNERGLALAYLSVSEKRQSLADLQEATRLLNRLLTGKPDGALATAAGLLALRQSKNRQAVEWLQLAVSEEPGSSVAHSNLAAALLADGDRAGAARHAREAIRIEPLLEEPYAILESVDSKGNWREAYRKRARR